MAADDVAVSKITEHCRATAKAGFQLVKEPKQTFARAFEFPGMALRPSVIHEIFSTAVTKVKRPSIYPYVEALCGWRSDRFASVLQTKH